MEDCAAPVTIGQGAGARVVTLDLPAVHARRRDDAGRAALDAAARPLRHPAPARGLRARGPRAHRPPLGRDPRRPDRTRPARSRSPRRSRGTPRVANRLLRRVRDWAEVRGDGRRHGRRRRRGAGAARGRSRGLDRLDRDILSALCTTFSGGARRAVDARRSPSARRRTRSRTSTSRTCCSAGCCAARRAGASRPPAPTSIWGSSLPGSSRCSDLPGGSWRRRMPCARPLPFPRGVSWPITSSVPAAETAQRQPIGPPAFARLRKAARSAASAS